MTTPRTALMLLAVLGVLAMVRAEYMPCPAGHHPAAVFDADVSWDILHEPWNGYELVQGENEAASWGNHVGGCDVEFMWKVDWAIGAESYSMELEVAVVGNWTGETPFNDLPSGLCQESATFLWGYATEPRDWFQTTIGANNISQCFPESWYCSQPTYGGLLSDFDTTLPDGSAGSLFNISFSGAWELDTNLEIDLGKIVGSCSNPTENCANEYIAVRRATLCVSEDVSPISVSHGSGSNYTVHTMELENPLTLDPFNISWDFLSGDPETVFYRMYWQSAAGDVDGAPWGQAMAPFLATNNIDDCDEWNGLTNINFTVPGTYEVVLTVFYSPGDPWNNYYEEFVHTVYVDDPSDNCNYLGVCTEQEEDQDECEPPFMTCPSNGTMCVSALVECLGLSTQENGTLSDTCTGTTTLCWSTGECVEDLEAECNVVPGCNGHEFPLRCWDGSCHADNGTCQPAPDCPNAGETLCNDGVCRDVHTQECPESDACDVETPFRCANGQCAASSGECGDELCPGDAVLCWNETCSEHRVNCDLPPFLAKIEPKQVLLEAPVSLELDVTGSSAAVSLEVGSCHVAAGGVLNGTALQLGPVATSRFSAQAVRSPVISAELLNSETNDTLSSLGVGNLIAGLRLDFASTLKAGETLSSTCIAGLDQDTGEWECILEYDDYATLLALAEVDPCNPDVMLSAGTATRGLRSSGSDPGRFSVFAQIVGEINGALDGDDVGTIIVSTVATILVMLLLLTMWVGFCFLLRSARESRPPQVNRGDGRITAAMDAARDLKAVFKSPSSDSWAAFPAWESGSAPGSPASALSSPGSGSKSDKRRVAFARAVAVAAATPPSAARKAGTASAIPDL